jgi:hypothetical protein
MCRARGSGVDREHSSTPISDVVSHFASPNRNPTSTKLCKPLAHEVMLMDWEIVVVAAGWLELPNPRWL